MSLASFFDRIYGSLGGHLAVSRETLLEALGGTVVAVVCGKEGTQNDIWIAELSVNLAARLYPALDIRGPDAQVSRLRDLAKQINPRIDFPDTATPERLTISVGAAVSAKEGIHPTATGWVARAGYELRSIAGPSNPYASATAASIACAELFRRTFLQAEPSREISVSLLDYGSEAGSAMELPDVDLGPVLFAGVGAVGNAALWTLARHAGLKGRLYLVDGESIERSNLQRYVLASDRDVGKVKVKLAEKALSGTTLEIEPSQNTLELFAKSHAELKIPTIAVSVDNVDSRRTAQGLLPKVVVNGWTGNQALGASWHVFGREAACLACLYQPTGPGVSQTEQSARALGLPHDRAAMLWASRQPLSDSDIEIAAEALGIEAKALSKWRGKPLGELYTDVVCGSVPLDLKGVGKLEAVPLAHQSALAGVMMAAELAKRTTPQLHALSQSEPLVSWDNILQPPPSLWKKPRPRERGCICTDGIYQRVYREKWPNAASEFGPRG